MDDLSRYQAYLRPSQEVRFFCRARLYPARTAHRDRHHCSSRGPSAAGSLASEGQGENYPVLIQSRDSREHVQETHRARTWVAGALEFCGWDGPGRLGEWERLWQLYWSKDWIPPVKRP